MRTQKENHTPTLHPLTLDLLRKGKNLLAFSAGVDSCALFFLLIENKIPFDIALVNYGIRQQAQEEEAYALALAKRYHLQIHLAQAPRFEGNFEKSARDFRYHFFEQIIQEHYYENLLTAHQLNDQLEWLLMRLSKGAGAVELIGLEPIAQRQGYHLLRPLLHHSKEELQNYLNKRGNRYFLDASNQDEKHERNWFRKHLANKLIQRYSKGIARSFEYLLEDKKALQGDHKECYQHQAFYILKPHASSFRVRVIDRYLKRLGYLLSAGQRQEIEENNSIVLGGIWAVEVVKERIFIAPYRPIPMPKKFKEACRVANIPPKVRGYLYDIGLDPNLVVLQSS